MKPFLVGAILMASHSFSHSSEPLKIVTIDSEKGYVLEKKTDEIGIHELDLAKEIGDKLFTALKPRMPAAGLAAPQIGISKAIFIFSYDRSPENLELVINPRFQPLGEEHEIGWEACFSAIMENGQIKVAKVPRYEKILVSYLHSDGKVVEKTLTGFAAKVFQHEYDHLQGIENIKRPDAEVKTFNSKEEFITFLTRVKAEDAKRYRKPE